MVGLLLVLQGLAFSPLQDSVALAATADSFGVSRDIAFAVAWMETRDGKRWNVLGPGVIDSTWLADGTLRVHRVCRELGRYQLRGCVDWTKMLGDARCTRQALRTSYTVGLHCGLRNLRRLWTLCLGDALCTIRKQNGSGPKAEIYLTRALAYLGYRTLVGGKN